MTENNQVAQKQQQEESEWSLSSLQELKGLNLQDLKDEEDRDEMPKENQAERKPKMEPKYPAMQQLSSDCKFYPVGKIIQKIGELVIVEASSCINLVDLDNWLFVNLNSEQKQCVGFVMDIFGRVDHPYYAIKMLQEAEKKCVYWGEMTGMELFYAQGCKTLTEQDIRSIKEKSSMHKQADQGSDSSSEQAQLHEQNDSDQMEQRSNLVMRDHGHHYDRRRKASYQEEFRRDRTREKKKYHREFEDQMHDRHHDRRNHRHHNVEHRNQARDRMHNQQYLESMYATYYTQMMQLYNGQNGMPMPKPPVFPPASQPTISPFMQPHMQPQMQMFPTPPTMQMPLFPVAVSPFDSTVLQPGSYNSNPNNPR